MDRRQMLLSLTAAGALPVAAQEPPPLLAEGERGKLRLSRGADPLFTYHRSPVGAPEGVGALFTRSAYLHPVHAPNGAVVTDDFPADHRHQRGIFFAWTRTRMDLDGWELAPDFWNLGSGTGRIVSVRAQLQSTGDQARLTTEHEWQARRGDGWLTVLDERWEISVLRPPAGDWNDPSASYWFDLTSRQRPRFRIELPEYRYGGMAIRGARDWLSADSGFRVLTSEGKDRRGADGAEARWFGMSGRVGDREAGFALLEHPANLGAPNRVRMHPDVPYGVFSPPQGAARVLEQQREYVFRFRVVVHNGRTSAARIDAEWRRFAGPG